MTLPPTAASVPTARPFVDARLREHGEAFRAEDVRPVVRPVAALSTGGRGLTIVSRHGEARGVHAGRRNVTWVWASFDSRP